MFKRFGQQRAIRPKSEEVISIRLLLFFNIVISVVAPLLVKTWNAELFTPAQEVFFALSCFTVLTVFEISLIVRDVTGKIRSDFALWEARDQVDAKMSEIRRMLHKVRENSLGSFDLFDRFIFRKLDQLETLLVDATTKQEIRIDETMFQVTSDLLLSAFGGRETDIFRALHFCEDNDFFFDIYSNRYFRQAYELVQKRRINEVRRLIVYANDGELRDARTKLLAAFHVTNDHFECRLISLEKLNRILEDFGLHYLMRDFGIYGERYLYKAHVTRAEKIVGTYSKNLGEIRRFIECFEACWVSPSATTFEAGPGEKVSIEDLLTRGPKGGPGSSSNIVTLSVSNASPQSRISCEANENTSSNTKSLPTSDRWD